MQNTLGLERCKIAAKDKLPAKTIAALLNEINFQRVCQEYIWSIPLVSMAQCAGKT